MTQASEDHGETEAIGGSRSMVCENSDEFRRKDTEGIRDFLVGSFFSQSSACPMTRHSTPLHMAVNC